MACRPCHRRYKVPCRAPPSPLNSWHRDYNTYTHSLSWAEVTTMLPRWRVRLRWSSSATFTRRVLTVGNSNMGHWRWWMRICLLLPSVQMTGTLRRVKPPYNKYTRVKVKWWSSQTPSTMPSLTVQRRNWLLSRKSLTVFSVSLMSFHFNYLPITWRCTEVITLTAHATSQKV